MNKKQTSASGNSRRDQLRAQQDKEARERKVRNSITFSILGVALLAVVGTLVWVVINASRPSDTIVAGSTDQYAVLVGSDDAPVKVDIYLDFMCPYCGQFERANSADLNAVVEDGSAQLRIHAMSFLDQASQGTKFSTRAANAFVTVGKNEPDKVLAFNNILFENQPEENSAGLSDAQIADFARQAGVSNDTVAQFAAGANNSFVESTTKNAFANGVSGTPTVKINDTKFPGDMYTAGPLKAAIAEAAAK